MSKILCAKEDLVALSEETESTNAANETVLTNADENHRQPQPSRKE